MIPANDFFDSGGGPPRQGDILIAGVARLTAEDRFCPPRWGDLDEIDITLDGGPGQFLVAAPKKLVMITSHDCHFDKEWNRRRTELMKVGHSAAEAEEIAEADKSLDRTFTASPLLDPDDVDTDRGNLMAGRVMGYLPVPESTDGRVPESVVDLTYRCTMDVIDVERVTRVSDRARESLRYELARLDVLRSPALGFKFEEAIGRQIVDVKRLKRNPLVVQIRLEDETVIELLQRPGEPDDDAPARSGARGRA